MASYAENNTQTYSPNYFFFIVSEKKVVTTTYLYPEEF